MSQQEEFVPAGTQPLRVLGEAGLDLRDPLLNTAVEDVIAALRQDLLPSAVQLALVNAMSPSARRDMVSKVAGLDASVLMTFKQQISLVDTVLRRIVNEDGTVTANAGEYDIPLKDALNLSLKVTQVMVRDLPKIYTLDRVQKQEEALRRVMEKCLTRDQQEQVLLELEKIEHGQES